MKGYALTVEERILKAAKTLFAQKGHDETKLREIAASARTSESQVIKYFQSKVGILDALMTRAGNHLKDSFAKILETTDDPVFILENTPSIFFDLLENDSELLKVYLFSRRFYTFIPEAELLSDVRFRAQVVTILKRGQRTKIFREDLSPGIAASLIWGMLLGLMRDKFYTQRISGFSDFSREEAVIAMKTVIRSFLSSRS